jgi:hypothetical protein
MTEHYSHVDVREKQQAASRILRLLTPTVEVGDQVGDPLDHSQPPTSETATNYRNS